MKNQRSILVIAAHPDDELLGVGGTVRRHVLMGDAVHSIILCESETVRYQDRNIPMEEFVNKAAKILGTTVEFVNYPDQRLEEIALVQIAGEIEKRVKNIKPQIVYSQFCGDINLDHKRAFDATLLATRPMADFVQAVYAFETCSSTEWAWPQQFHPDTFIDISDTLETKIEAFAAYVSEVREWPHPRSLESLRYRAKYFGSIACMDAAEPFITIRSYKRKHGQL